MIGMGGAKFQPDTEMSRAMLVTVLYRIAGEPAVKGTAPFRDVEKNSWYTNAVIWADVYKRQGLGYRKGLPHCAGDGHGGK